MFPLLYFFSDWAITAARIVLSIVFVAHGWPKIKNLKTTANNFAAMGFRPGALWGTVAALLEFFGGIALLVGFAVQIVAAFFIVQFLVIVIWKLASRQPLAGGYELDLLILVLALLFLTIGGGALSLDRQFFFGGF